MTAAALRLRCGSGVEKGILETVCPFHVPYGSVFWCWSCADPERS